MASDLFWLTNEHADPRDAVSLMRGMVEWAKPNPQVVEIRCGTTAIMNDPEGAGKLLQHMGFKPYGNIYRMEVTQ
ncbi:hypothetical protein ACHMW7_16265 [Aminobacter sp. UC22_36]|uniref:hypothetical protein n=1 Tax=Aminobacter sp. UC22_36 TaxID=3374549 RepID=UPI0037564902